MWRKRKEITPESERRVTDPERARERTMNRAVRLLAAKPRSVTELRERLMEKSWTNGEIVNSVIQRLQEYKYLDDQQFAADLAVSKLRQKPQGKRRLWQSLSQKKLDKEVIEEAVKTAFEKLPEDLLIDSAIARRIRLKGQPETREDTKKFLDYLLRRGFSYELIREKISSIAKNDIEQDGS
jgi:regulatory protein